MTALRRAFIGASIAWAATLLLTTIAAAYPRGSSVIYVLVLSVYAIGSLICHQLPVRSFHLWSAQMPVCARCTGIYFGAALAALLAGVARRLRPSVARSPKGFALLALVPTIATLVFEWTTGVTPSNTIRALAGLPLGVAVAWIVLASPDASERCRAPRESDREVN